MQLQKWLSQAVPRFLALSLTFYPSFGLSIASFHQLVFLMINDNGMIFIIMHESQPEVHQLKLVKYLHLQTADTLFQRNQICGRPSPSLSSSSLSSYFNELFRPGRFCGRFSPSPVAPKGLCGL
jgi:hypothetical protein